MMGLEPTTFCMARSLRKTTGSDWRRHSAPLRDAARLLTWSCTDNYNAIGITALHAHLGYFMIVASPTTSSRASNRTAFSRARASFRFLSK